MEELIKQVFLHLDIIGPEVLAGHYDLIGPSGETILPQLWEKVIEPGWAITMHMWPMKKPPGPMKKLPPMDGPSPRPEGNQPSSMSLQSPPRPPPPPPAPHVVNIEKPHKEKKSSIGSFMSKSLKRLKGRQSSLSSNLTPSTESLADD